jgi:hypothetical protein
MGGRQDFECKIKSYSDVASNKSRENYSEMIVNIYGTLI